MRRVQVINEKGAQRTISEKSWELLKSAGQPANVRKGWQFVRFVDGGPAPQGAIKPSGNGAVAPFPMATFVPDEIKEVANIKKESAMISGEPEVAVDPDPAPVADPKPVEPEVAAPAAEPAVPSTDEPVGDDIAGIAGVGAKAAEALAGAGIRTFKQLAEAPIGDINKALEVANLAPKKAQVPNWKQAAKAKSKPVAQ